MEHLHDFPTPASSPSSLQNMHYTNVSDHNITIFYSRKQNYPRKKFPRLGREKKLLLKYYFFTSIIIYQLQDRCFEVVNH